jgi:hypothetical protein
VAIARPVDLDTLRLRAEIQAIDARRPTRRRRVDSGGWMLFDLRCSRSLALRRKDRAA